MQKIIIAFFLVLGHIVVQSQVAGADTDKVLFTKPLDGGREIDVVRSPLMAPTAVAGVISDWFAKHSRSIYSVRIEYPQNAADCALVSAHPFVG